MVAARRAIIQRERARARERERVEQQGRPRHIMIHYGVSAQQEYMSAASIEEREKARKAQQLYELLVSFPTHTHASNDDVKDSETECAICLAAFATGDRLKRLSCAGGHCFHSRCLRQWFQTSLPSGKTQCPVCRHECGAGGGDASPSTPPPSAQLYAA